MAQMADNIVVIGKGKLIASTSMAQLVAGSAHSGVYVRVPDLSKLVVALKKSGHTYVKLDDGIKVANATTDEVGKMAFAAGTPVLELTNQSASLEEAFLELTADAQEYKTHGEKEISA
jgi:ABC-2 type transport system ATP-binding protein